MFKKSKLKLKSPEPPSLETRSPKVQMIPPQSSTWMDDFRSIHDHNQVSATYWFWDHFDWSSQSLWIGKINRMNRLPTTDEQISAFLKKLIHDLDQNLNLQSKLYIKFYFSRNINTHEPEINYLLICDSPQLPNEFSNTLIDIVFERYQLTETIINQNDMFKSLINHYLHWNNFYTYYNLMSEIHN